MINRILHYILSNIRNIVKCVYPSKSKYNDKSLKTLKEDYSVTLFFETVTSKLKLLIEGFMMENLCQLYK